MATVASLKNPSSLGPLTKEHFIVRRETKGYYYSSGKLVYDKIQAGTEVTAINTFAVFSDGAERKLNSMTIDGKVCSTVMLGDLDPIQVTASRRIYLIADADLIWDGAGNAQSMIDHSFRLAAPTTTTTTTTTTTKTATQPSTSDYPLSDSVAYKMYVTASSLNVRSDASANATKIGSLSEGDEVSISNYNPEKLGEWARIIYKGSPAYVSSQYLSKTKPKPTTTTTIKPTTTTTTTKLTSQQVEDSFFTPALVISGLAATGLLMWAIFGKQKDKKERGDRSQVATGRK